METNATSQTNHEQGWLDTTPFLQNMNTTQQETKSSDESIKSKSCVFRLTSYVDINLYPLTVAVLAVTGGVLFGYDLGIISGAILQLRDEFCLGILRSEVRLFRHCLLYKFDYL